jgi:hypothetical protein
MKKMIAVLIAGTFIIGSAVAQTSTTPAAKPAEKKETVAPQKKGDGTSKMEHKKKHHRKMKDKKAPVTTPQAK